MKRYLPLIFVLIAMITPSSVAAQEKLSVTAIPPRLELEALPGATIQESLRVRNETATDQVFTVAVQDFIVIDRQGTPLAVSEKVSGRWSLASWLTVSPKKLLLPAGMTAAVDLIISIPKDALPGGHYAMVTYVPVGEEKLNGSGALISPRVGSLIYLKVIGDATEAVNLKEFKVDQVFKAYGPTQIVAEIENLGDIHVRPEGKLTVTNWLKDEVYSAALEEKNIFPFASRTYDWEMPGKWRFGRYQARLTAAAGEAAIPLSGSIYFWIIPVKELTLITMALAAISWLISLKKRRRRVPPPPITPESAILK
jgi:hypothetical protein